MVVVGEFVGEKSERERGEMKCFGSNRMKTEQKFDLYKTLNLGATLLHPMIFVKRGGKFDREKIWTFGCDFVAPNDTFGCEKSHPMTPLGADFRTQ